MRWQSLLFAFLSASLFRPVVLAGLAWVVLRALRVRHPVSRHAVWTAVLIGMSVLPVVSVVGPQWKLPLLPAKYEIAAVPGASAVAPPAVAFDSTMATVSGSATVSHETARFERPSLETIVVGCWLLGVIAMLLYRLAGFVMLRRVLSRSRSIRGGRMRESDDVFTPVAVGVLRPCVLLPTGWRTWSIATKRAVLAHEFAHLRRRDTLVAALARLAKCVFWFHALVWWISRHVADLAELSCDAAALDRTRDPEFYSYVLLNFASIVKGAGRRSALPGLAMAAGSGMGPRIDFIYELSAGGLKKLSRPGMLLAIAGLPIACFAAVFGLTSPVIRTIVPPAVYRAPQPVMIAQAQPPAPAKTQPVAPAAPRPEFDAVSVKRCLPGDEVNGPPGGRGGRGPRVSPGRLRMQCMSLRSMIQFAYLETSGGPLLNRSTPPEDGSWVKGGPPWIENDWYVVDAETHDAVANNSGRGPNSAPWKRMGQMLQVALEDRFQLNLHRETEDVPMYSLVIAKGGLKLNPMEKDGCIQPDPDAPIVADLFPASGKPMCFGRLGVRGQDWLLDSAGQPLSGLASILSDALNRHVFDKTGLTDLFIYHLEFAHDDTAPGNSPPGAFPPSDDPAGPSIFSELEKLGLKLEPTKGPRGLVVIDHVARPSEN